MSGKQGESLHGACVAVGRLDSMRNEQEDAARAQAAAGCAACTIRARSFCVCSQWQGHSTFKISRRLRCVRNQRRVQLMMAGWARQIEC